MKKLTTELAELCGILAGDGHLSRYISKKRTDYKIYFSGHLTDDKEYMSYIQNLFYKVTGKSLYKYKKKNYIELVARSKELLEMFENIGIPVGKKSHIVRIPKQIKNDLKLSCAFVRGVADTDFSLVYRKRKTVRNYPRITTDLASKNLINDICEVLDKLRIKYNGPYVRKRVTRLNYPYTNYEIDICGHNNLKLWMKHIGLRNPKHLNKWRKNNPPI